MKIYITILFLLLIVQVGAQNYFNNVYDQPGYNMANDVVEVDSNYYVIGQNINTVNRLIKCYKLNFDGDTIWVKNYEDGNKIFYTQKIMDEGSGLYVFGSYRDSADVDSSDFFLAKFTYNFDLEWIKDYGGEFFEGAMDMIRTQDNGLLLSGSSVGELDGYENFYVVKTDSLGNEQWYKRYFYVSYCRIANVVQLEDESFIASGISFIPPVPDTNGHYDFMLLKFDKFGDELWRKTFGTIKDEDALFISKFDDHSLLINGSSQHTNNINYRGYFAKIDYDGNEIYSKYISEYITMFYNAKPLITNDNSYLIPSNVTNSNFESFAVLYKYNPTGELLWFRELRDSTYYNSNILSIQNNFNNGFLISGWAFDSLNIQSAWVAKTDCFGCDSTLCYYPDSICDVYDCSLYPINSDFSASSYLVDYNFNDSVQFVNLSANTTNRVWDFGDGTIAYTDSAVSHLYSATGTYEVQLIVYHGACSDTLIQTVVVSDNVGLSEVQLNALISAYPNPSNGSFSIENKTGKELKIEISDALGKTIEFTTVGINTTSNLVNVNTQKNGSGIYFLTLSDGEFIFRQKIVLE